jgi:hypothetical protein
MFLDAPKGAIQLQFRYVNGLDGMDVQGGHGSREIVHVVSGATRRVKREYRRHMAGNMRASVRREFPDVNFLKRGALA